MIKQWILAVVVVVGLAAAAQAQIITVQCVGTESGGWGGPLNSPYCYEINLPTGAAMTGFDVGDHTGTCPGIYAVDVNGVAIPGWMGGCGVPGAELDFDGKTAHGAISLGPTGSCPNITLWTGPALPMPGIPLPPYFFGHFSTKQSHDVGWTVMAAAAPVKEIWTAPVGAGAGPVHAPIPEPATLGLFAAGALLVLRRRRQA